MNKYAPVIRNRDVQESTEAINRVTGILRNGWLIGAVFILVASFGTYHALTATPSYETSTVIQIRQNPAFAGDFRAEDHANTEMEVLRSRSILSRVVQRLQLDIVLDPEPPSFARSVSRLLAFSMPVDRDGSTLEWEHVARFNVPPQLFNRPFILTVLPDNAFALANERLGITLTGTAGHLVEAPSRYGTLGILIDKNDAAPGARFILRRISAGRATEQLQHALAVSENVKQSNVIKLALQGTNPPLMSRILSEIVGEYMHLRAAAQHEEGLGLIASYDRQLDESKAALRDNEQRYMRRLRQSGIGDPEAESQALVQQSNALELQLADAQQRKAELSARVGDGHPAMEAIDRQIANAMRNLNRNAARREALVAAGRELATIRRDKQAMDEGALVLFNQRSKLKAMVSAERDDVRVLDRPETSFQTVTPSIFTMIVLSCFGGVLLGLFASFVKNAILQRRRMRLSAQRETRFRLVSLDRTEHSGMA